MRIADALKTADEVVACPVEELAWLVLEYLKKAVADNKQLIYKGAVTTPEVAREYGHRDVEVTQIVMEAWAFLESHGLLVPWAGYNGAPDLLRFRVSRRGQQLDTKAAWDQFVRTQRLPETLLHPLVLTTSYAAYLRGEYDAAVLMALVAIENEGRTRCTRPPNETAVPMFSTVFGQGGPLRDPQMAQAEADGLVALFRGMYGYWRNSVGHRVVGLTEVESGQLLIAASNLIALLEKHIAEAQAHGRL